MKKKPIKKKPPVSRHDRAVERAVADILEAVGDRIDAGAAHTAWTEARRHIEMTAIRKGETGARTGVINSWVRVTQMVQRLARLARKGPGR